MAFLSTGTGVGVIDTRSRQGTITLPLTSQIANRYIQFKDLYGAFGRSSLTVSTQGGEAFDDGTTSKVYTDPFTFLTLYAASTTRWAQMGGTQTIQQTVSSLVVSSLTIGSGFGWLQLPPVQTVAVSTNAVITDSVTANSTTSFFISGQVLYVSSIIGPVLGAGNLTTANLTSTVAGLGTNGYVSTSQLVSTSFGLADHIEVQSTSRGLGTLGYLSSLQFQISSAALFTSSITASTITTSSLQVNSLTIGTGTGWVNLGPIQTVALSSIQTNTNALYANTSFFGTQSTATALQFFGLFSNYNNTVLAEVSTGAGTQELLLFKGSSTSDRVRVQTTGAFVVETGVSARLWPTINSNATPAFVINTSSNVGIQTASPGAALDVAGIGRFQTTSTQILNVSSINGNPYKSFVIDHPIDSQKYLVHACLEGPEVGVYYRGEGTIQQEKVTITLPEYVSVFAHAFTVQVTPIYESEEEAPRCLMVTRVWNGSFTVKGAPGSFYWHVYGKRASLEAEPVKTSVSVLGQGPYKWILG